MENLTLKKKKSLKRSSDLWTKVMILVLLVILLVVVGQSSSETRIRRWQEKEDAQLDRKTRKKKNGKNRNERQSSAQNRAYDEIAANRYSSHEPYIMFWRPQKVGSSTIESILVSYAYRHYLLPRLRSEGMRNSNILCSMIALCGLAKADQEKSYAEHREELKDVILMMMSTNSLSDKHARNIDRNDAILKKFKPEDTVVPYQYKISVNHQICNLPSHIVNNEMHCAFSPNITDTIRSSKKVKDFNIKQVFAVREPLSRAVSVYYYWGECYKVGKLTDDKTAFLRARGKQIGSYNTTVPIQGPHLVYHGQETTVPPADIAMKYANNLPYVAGLPGPSYTWSAFSNDYKEAVEQVDKGDIMTIVIERMDESLVVLAHYFGWSLAEVTQTISKKNSSPHPKHSSWPVDAVSAMKQALVAKGEYAVYKASNNRLDARIKSLKSAGFDVDAEVELLKLLKQEVAATCGDLSYLQHYRKVLNRDKLKQHGVVNKLREVDDVYFEEGHVFSYGNEILYSFDICNSCKAHAILYSANSSSQGYVKSTNGNSHGEIVSHKANLLSLIAADKKVKKLPQFTKCIL